MQRSLDPLRAAGLAATQVASHERVLVHQANSSPSALINPRVEEASNDHVLGFEGCLSIPGKRLVVMRPTWVVVSYVTIDGHHRTDRFEEFAARVVCHEIDHLDGRLMTAREYVPDQNR